MDPIIEKVKHLYDKCIVKDAKPKDLIDLQTVVYNETRPFVDYFLGISLDDLRDNLDLELELATILKAASIIYEQTGMDTHIEDPEYDKLWEKLDLLHDLRIDLDITQPVVTNKPKGYHLYPSLRGTLDKIYYLGEKLDTSNRRGLRDWVNTSGNTIKERTGEAYPLWDTHVYIFPKWDGVSAILEYDEMGDLQRALTRGYTKLNEAIIVTAVFKELAKTIPTIGHRTSPFGNGKPFGVKFEIMTKSDDLARYNLEHPKKPYKNTRAFASAIMNGETKGDLKELIPYLVPVPLRASYLEEGDESLQILEPGVFSYPHLYCNLDDFEKIEEFAKEHHEIGGLRCDGAVIYIIDEKIQKILGRENNKQKFEVAYKFTEVYGYTEVTDVRFSLGLYGNVTPVVHFKPIQLKGNMVQKASLGSIGNLMLMELGPGDIIKIGYDIIPVATFDPDDPKCKHSRNPRIEVPKNCPLCGQPLEIGEVTACCDNVECPSKKMGKIKSHIERMNIAYVGDSLIEQMYNAHLVDDIPDIYKLRKVTKELMTLDNFGAKKCERLINSIQGVVDTPIDEARLYGSLCIKHLSTATFQKIFDKITEDDLLDAVDNEDYDALKKISGIGEMTAHWIIDGLQEKSNKETLKFLKKTYTVRHYTKIQPKFELVFSSFGANDERKKTVAELVESTGGAVRNSISGRTNFLVVPTHSINSTKAVYAKNHKIPIYTAEEFIQRYKAQD